MIAADKSAQAFASVVPFPIHNSDAGCSLEALLVTPNAEAVLVSLTGFKPGVSLDLESTSESEAGRSSGKADEKGNYEWIILPFRKGLTKGRTQVTVHADGCSPTLSFAWGTGSYVLQ
ncbi:MAG: hypothetical protein M3N93_04780 [Acidobacteriota bacterium]|nr:hypothetical protein [Acidobacteriota bacterium]